MKLKDWSLCLEYVAFECAEFPDVDWDVYTMYDGRKGIQLMRLDSTGHVFAEAYTGIVNSFEEMKAAVGRSLRRLMGC